MNLKFIFLCWIIPITSFAQIQAVGDTMLGENINKYNLLLNPVKEIFNQKNKINIINLEGVITNELYESKCGNFNNVNNCFAFKQNSIVAKILYENNIHIANLANNHSMDYGIKGLIDTNNHLKINGINSIGLEFENYKEVILNNKKYVFIGMSPHKGTQSIFDLTHVISKIKEYKNNNVIVVISAHIGAEGITKYIVKNEEEIFLGKSRGNPIKLAHTLIDAGADVFLAHGPHVLRPLEVYKNKLIAYSLGNFLTYGAFDLNGRLGYGGILGVNLKNNGNFDNGYFIGTKQTKSYSFESWNKGLALEGSNESLMFLREITESHSPNTFVWKENTFKLKY